MKLGKWMSYSVIYCFADSYALVSLSSRSPSVATQLNELVLNYLYEIEVVLTQFSAKTCCRISEKDVRTSLHIIHNSPCQIDIL